MSDDLRFADSRALHEPFSRQLASYDPDGSLRWIVGVLATQSNALRSSNAELVAYTGNRAAIDWLEATVASPVTGNWGRAAALLGTPWPRISHWLNMGGPHLLMGLDTLIAYRKPAPNMSPLAQIAAPVLPQAPSPVTFEADILACLKSNTSPRIQEDVKSVLGYAGEILKRDGRGVPVESLPQLYLFPEKFLGAGPILDRQESMISGMRRSFEALLKSIGR